MRCRVDAKLRLGSRQKYAAETSPVSARGGADTATPSYGLVMPTAVSSGFDTLKPCARPEIDNWRRRSTSENCADPNAACAFWRMRVSVWIRRGAGRLLSCTSWKRSCSNS